MIRWLTLLAGIAFACAMLWYSVTRPIAIGRAKRAANLSMQRVTRNFGSVTSRHKARQTLERLEPFVTASDRDAELLVLAAASAYSIGDLKRAEKHYAEAAALEGRPEIMAYLGAVQAEMGLLDQATASYARAVAFAPSFIHRDEIGALRSEVETQADAIRAGRQ